MEKDEAAKLVTDRYSSQIIFATSMRPKSAQGLSQQCGIPIAACYRRIKALEEIGVIEYKERFLNPRGKWIRLYLSNVKGMEVSFDGGKMLVKVSFKDGRTKKIGAGAGSAETGLPGSAFDQP
ncbi:MAG: helix-turn-helix domain-containing protein [Methanobacteriota archaeon]